MPGRGERYGAPVSALLTAAAATGRLPGLAPEGAGHALGIAATQAAGFAAVAAVGVVFPGPGRRADAAGPCWRRSRCWCSAPDLNDVRGGGRDQDHGPPPGSGARGQHDRAAAAGLAGRHLVSGAAQRGGVL